MTIGDHGSGCPMDSCGGFYKVGLASMGRPHGVQVYTGLYLVTFPRALCVCAGEGCVRFRPCPSSLGIICPSSCWIPFESHSLLLCDPAEAGRACSREWGCVWVCLDTPACLCGCVVMPLVLTHESGLWCYCSFVCSYWCADPRRCGFAFVCVSLLVLRPACV